MKLVAAWLRPDAPAERLAIVRVLVGLFACTYLLVRFRYFGDLSRHSPSELSPVGVASWLETPLPSAVTWALAVLALASGAAFTRGLRPRLSGVVFFAALLWLTTYRSSFGKILHSENLLVLHVGVLALAPWLGAPMDRRSNGWALRTMAIATALTYVVAGVSKLRAGGSAWVSGHALAEWLAFDAVRKIELGSLHSPVAGVVASSPAICAALAVFTLAVELGAPLALVSSRTARLWALAAWAFHLGILVTMAIGFFYPLSGIAFAPLFAVEKIRWGRRRSSAR